MLPELEAAFSQLLGLPQYQWRRQRRNDFPHLRDLVCNLNELLALHTCGMHIHVLFICCADTMFDLNLESGVLKLRQSLDREQQASYLLEVKVNSIIYILFHKCRSICMNMSLMYIDLKFH